MHFNTKKALVNFLKDVCIVWAGIAFYRYLPYYSTFLKPATQHILFAAGILYLITSFPIQYHKIKQGQKSKADIFFHGICILLFKIRWMFFAWIRKKQTEPPALKKEERTVLLFYLVKFFYIPLMIDFACWNAIYLKNFIPYIPAPSQMLSFPHYFNNYLYPVIYSGVFFLNSAIYTFGYMFEFDFLNNKVRSVDPSLAGWVVCIICYPPFSFWYAHIFPSYANEMAFFINEEITFFMRLVISGILFFMLFAVIVLGTKCSNLVHRGIVTSGPYSLIRHPHYATKNLIWWLTGLPVFIHKPIGMLFLAVWSFTYYLRSITEERHLAKDPAYRAYCARVKYRFIPHVF